MLLNMNTTYQTNRFLFFTLLFLFGFATSLSLTAQTIYYVDATKANNDGDGTSWATAKKDLQVALDTATPGDEIRVASGTYFPTDAPNGSTTNDRNKAFHLNKDLILKGSYDPATEMQDYTNPSILSGDIGMQDDNTDNAYHVLITANLSSDAIIDGFTFSGGNADGTGSLVFDSESFTRDDGGGIYNYESSPTITNSTFHGNSAKGNGGGMVNEGSIGDASTPKLYNTVFYANTASESSDIFGNAIDESSSHNASDGTGGGINAGTGFVALTPEEDPFTNSADPAGADDILGTPDDGLVPSSTSPLVDAGVDSQNEEETDITGGDRVMGTAIDIGAYEDQTSLSSDMPSVETTTLYPNPYRKRTSTGGVAFGKWHLFAQSQ